VSEVIKISGDKLFDRVVSILEQAKSNVVKAVNSNMVIAYWMIGREIVEEIQQGEDRAEYGKQIVENLSELLLQKYGSGYSTTNLWYFRQFYIVYSDRVPEILHTPCGELIDQEILHKACGEFENMNGHEPGDKDKTIVKYSVLNENKQIFASKYMMYLPTEEELVRELEREKRLIEMWREDEMGVWNE
jgi:hypothetical protein